MLFRATAAVLFATVVLAQTPNTQRTIRVPRVESQEGLTEITNMVRTITGIPQIKSDLASRSLELTGGADQIAAAEWIVNALQNPSGQRTTFSQYQDPRLGDQFAVRVFFLQSTTTPQGAQEIVNAVRTLAGTQRIFPSALSPVIVLRGTLDQDAASEWLLNALDTPEHNPSSAEYRIPGNDPGLMRVMEFPASWTPEKVRIAVNQIRTETKIVRLFPVMHARVIAVRGTTAQVEEAKQLIK